MGDLYSTSCATWASHAIKRFPVTDLVGALDSVAEYQGREGILAQGQCNQMLRNVSS